MGVSDLSDVERPRLGNDIFKHPIIPQVMGIDPQDGLPRSASTVTMADSAAPALDPETFVCMGDESVFVVRDLWDEVRLTFEPDEVRRSGDEYFVARDTLSEKVLNVLGALEKELRDIGAKGEFETPWLKVEPLRPQCHYYRRVMTDFEGSDEHQTVERVCTAQRTEGGEYIALGNTRVYACEHRVPRDFVSEERLRKFDAERVAAGRKTEEEWDAEAALAEAHKDSEGDSENV
jgi:hypothetical protein